MTDPSGTRTAGEADQSPRNHPKTAGRPTASGDGRIGGSHKDGGPEAGRGEGVPVQEEGKRKAIPL